MKRIDDKIKEIEKNDKKNRILYYGIVALIIAFIAFASTTRKTINAQNAQIDAQGDTITKQLADLQASYDKLENTYEALENSLDPEEYWNSTVADKSVESYIDYITNEWGIKKTHLNAALTNIKDSNITNLSGWLYCGKTENGTFTDQRVTVAWREGSSENIQLTEPQVNDVIKLKSNRNLRTYKNFKLSNDNTEGWRPGTKAFVTEVRKEGIMTRIKIRYY